jgi:hypothetical protein
MFILKNAAISAVDDAVESPIKLDAVKALDEIAKTPPTTPKLRQHKRSPAIPPLTERHGIVHSRSISVGSAQEVSPMSVQRRVRAFSSGRLDDVWESNADSPKSDPDGCYQVLPGSAEARFSACTSKWQPVPRSFVGKAA